MTEGALKLYLTYPSEMEYWYRKNSDEDFDIEDDPDAKLLEQIAGEDKNLFIEALQKAYGEALTQFTESIVRPIQDQLHKTAKDCGLTIHRPRNRYYIANTWEWYLRPAKNRQKKSAFLILGCTFKTQNRTESESGLFAYPWIWASNQQAARAWTDAIGNNVFRKPEGEGWHPNTLATSPIDIAPGVQANDIAAKIAEVLGNAIQSARKIRPAQE